MFCHIYVPVNLFVFLYAVNVSSTLFLSGVFSAFHAGHVPVKDPHHSTFLRLHAGEEAGPLPVALPAPPNGWSHSSAGTSKYILKLQFANTQV